MKNRKKAVAALILVISAFLGVSAAALFWALSSKGGDNAQSSSSNISVDKIKDPKEGTINVLCVGVDLSEKLTDVLMVFHIDVKNDEVSLLQIPRDTFLGSEFPTGKINAVYGSVKNGDEGIKLLETEIEKRCKITIDNYAMVDLAALRDIVDDIGGVKMDVKQQINFEPGKVIKPGEQILNGEKAEWIVRYRKGYVTGDIGRQDAQKQFIFSAFNTVKEKGKVEMLKLFIKNFTHVKTDMPLNTALEYANYAQKISTDQIKSYRVPGEGAINDTFSVYEVNKAKLADIINEMFKYEGDKRVTADDMIFAIAKRNPVVKSSSDSTADNSGSSSSGDSESTSGDTSKSNDENSDVTGSGSSSEKLSHSSSDTDSSSYSQKQSKKSSSSDEYEEPPITKDSSSSD